MKRASTPLLTCFGLMLLSSLFLGCLSDNSKKAQAQLQADSIKAEEAEKAAQQKLIAKGKKLFHMTCVRCHSAHLEKASTGPALLGLRDRIPAGDWIYDFIQNSQKLIASGEPYAVKVWNENMKAAMDPAPHLSRADIDAIMAWIDSYQPPATPAR